MDIWFILALFLLAWNLYDLIKGRTSFHRTFLRSVDSYKYWLVWLLWFAISLLVLFTSETFILYTS